MARILVIDDDCQLRRIVGKVLQKAGHDVVEAAGGDEGIRLFRQNPTDIVITDVLMPETDGYEVIRVLARDFPGVAILAISGQSDPLSTKRAPSLAGQHMVLELDKPFRAQELLRAVERCLGLRLQNATWNRQVRNRSFSL